MKFLITYSTRTGNTRKIAEALFRAAPEGSRLSPMEEAPSPDDFDILFIGYWMDKGGPDSKAKAYLSSLHEKKIVLFETLGADPSSEHAYTGFANAALQLAPDCRILGLFASQGAIDPQLLSMMRKLPAGSPHNSPQMKALAEEAAKHPSSEDLARAEAYMKQFIKKAAMYNGDKRDGV